MVRTSAQDSEPATVTVGGVAFGLMALDLPVWMDAPAAWEAMDRDERREYAARARYLLGVAESTAEVELGGRVRWPEDLPPGAWGRTPGSTPNQVLTSGRIVPGRLVSSDEPSGESQ